MVTKRELSWMKSPPPKYELGKGPPLQPLPEGPNPFEMTEEEKAEAWRRAYPDEGDGDD